MTALTVAPVAAPVAAPELDRLLAEVRACRACEALLPLGPRPVLRAAASARIVIAGQAPGTAVHASGIPWDDPSGERLRGWLALDRETFYDPRRIAIIPQGFCYPGRLPRGGDRPPRPECAALWHQRLFALLPAVELTLVVGRYAQAYHLGSDARATVRKTVGETVAAWRDYLPRYLPLPHPSWRTIAWVRRNPWFEAETLPAARQAVHALLGAD
ncbi:MAG: uracil-DNA glycosylase family protein [Alphaproteobacteria bacterium]